LIFIFKKREIWFDSLFIYLFIFNIQVRDGPSASSPILIEKFCGSSLIVPFSVTSSWEQLYIEFHSDDVSDPNSTGFSASYVSTEKGNVLNGIASYE
jgi:hypothetical protein